MNISLWMYSTTRPTITHTEENNKITLIVHTTPVEHRGLKWYVLLVPFKLESSSLRIFYTVEKTVCILFGIHDMMVSTLTISDLGLRVVHVAT